MSSIIRQAPHNTRKASWRIGLVAGVIAAMAAGLTPAAAVDQQATDVQKDDAANQRAAAPYAHAEVPASHRSGAYASARPDEPAATAKPHKDFQDYK